MKTALLFLCILGIACAFSVKNFRRRFKADDSEENAVLKNRYRYFLHRYPYIYSPMKRFQSNSDSSEEGYGADSSEEEEEEEGGQSNEENNAENGEATEAPTTPGTGDKGVSHAKPPEQVPVRKEPLAKPGKEGGAQKGEKDKTPEKGGKKQEEEEDSDENEEEENEAEEEEEQVDENGSGVNGTSTNSTAEENGNGGNREEEEEENGATTATPTTVVTTVIPSTDYQYETTTDGQYMPSPEDLSTVENVLSRTDYYGSENGYPRGDTFRTYEDEYSYYKGHGYDVYGQDYYYNQ